MNAATAVTTMMTAVAMTFMIETTKKESYDSRCVMLEALNGCKSKETTTLTSKTLLGGSWVVISRVITRVTILIVTPIRGLITPLITTPEPPSRPSTRP